MAFAEVSFGDGMSMREKALHKRRINKQHSSNFKAGYVPINENYLHKTGIRGRKSFLVYGVVALLFLVVLGNLLVTLILLSVLRIGYGMEGLEFLPSGDLLKFLVPSDLNYVIPAQGIIGGFINRDLNIYGSNGGKLDLSASCDTLKPASISLEPRETTIKNVDSFRIINPNNGKTVFNTDYIDFGLPKSVKSINVKKAKLSRVTSPIDSSLTLSSVRQIHLLGSEGINMVSKEIVWSTEEDLILKSVNGSIHIRGLNGMFINVESHLTKDVSLFPTKKKYGQYKICVCKNNKRLFRIHVSANSHHYDCSNAIVSGKSNPCA
uniref:Beta-sarcoglycan n=1 Tax=Strigamia maritima TaxID=126957 RepID=T1J3F8_STRMM